MSIYALISPLPTWQAPSAIPVRPPARQIVSEVETWEDHAAAKDWTNAVLAYLRAKPRGVANDWDAVNAIVSESGQATRWEVRLATLEVLETLKALRHERQVLRYRHRQLALIESDPIIPLEQVPPRIGSRLAIIATKLKARSGNGPVLVEKRRRDEEAAASTAVAATTTASS
jgi:hypothetical protein